jgi:hypothetical protein
LRAEEMSLGHPNLYEGLTEGLPTKLYADIVLRTASRVEGDFERYKRHMDEVRDAFLVDVLGIPPESIRFEATEGARRRVQRRLQEERPRAAVRVLPRGFSRP